MHGRKKQIFYNDTRFYPDHDFPLELLKKRNEYTEAKKVRGEREGAKNKSSFRHRIRKDGHCFYEDGTQALQDVAEATKDMVEQGLPVKVVRSSIALDHKTLLLSAWQVVRR